jgi:hypothetical protein
LVGDWLAGERTSGGVAALALADRLVRRAAEDPALAEKLERTAVYVAPALDPDRRAEHLSGKAGTAGARFDRNFPTGWQPEGIRPGSGPYPLSLLESRALYGFLSGHREVAVALALGAPSSGDVRASAATAETLDALVSAWSSVGSDAVALLTPLAPGSWVEHCRTALGVHALVLDAGDGPPPDLLPGVLAVIDCLPELRFGAPTARALSPGLWQVDVELSNSGLLPTRSLPSPDGRGARVALEGGRLVAVAGGRPEATLAVLEAAADGSVPLADLGGGERYLLRLVVEAPAGTELSLSGDAAHARPTRTALRL